jgi:hypothetical protein
MGAAETDGFLSDTMIYIVLRDGWCGIIVTNVHASTEDETDDVNVMRGITTCIPNIP